jgi:hypothetical protein
LAHPNIRLLPDELVDDRALDSASGDEFRHSDFADELTDLVCEVPTPSNVALFAPWGSGKTGLGNMLAAGLKSRKDVRFARFDAFKYAETPLRRHFISQVAKSLGHKEDRFSDDLYRRREKRDFSFSKEQQARLAVAFVQTLALIALVLIALTVFVAAANSIVQHTRFWKEWSGALKGYLLVTVPVAAIVTAFVKLSGEGLVVNSTRSAPSGEEEFERVFKELVEKVGAKRLVIFIDELDRCSSDQVVSALETIKTFLEVPGCIFVVAADLQVLEQALRKEARQETPRDATNPYYSAGSSYLDKVFQYQIALPPLKPRRLTSFALTLVSERPGVWQRVENLAEVISVLIPTHVKSPRRVKVLLNSFALTYRLAERRAQEGVLAENLPARANEVAKLVCLRCEFPLFAEDLVLDQRLPELVRALADGDELPPNLTAEVAARARDYARGLLPVGALLVDETPAVALPGGAPAAQEPASAEAAAETEAVPPAAATAVPAVAAADAPTVPSEATTPQEDLDAEADEPPPAAEQSVQREYALQLVRYLRKVARVPGPGSDLIYLESAGASVDLEPAIADDLERAAIDGDVRAVVSTMSSLDEDKQRASVLLLAELVREAPVGIEGQNAVSTLLRTITQIHVDLKGIADTVAAAVAGHQAQIELHPDDLAGALTLALASNRTLGEHLRDGVLEHEAATERVDVALIAVAGAPQIPQRFDEILGRAATAAFMQDVDELISVLMLLPDAQVDRVCARIRGPLKDAVAALDADGKSEADASANMGAVLDAALDTGRPAVITPAFSLALSVGTTKFDQTVSGRLERLGTVTNVELAHLMLASTTGWVFEFWPEWLGALDVGVVAKFDDAAQLVGDAAAKLWREMATTEDANEVAKQNEGLKALKALAAGGVPVRTDELVAAVTEQLSGAFSTDAVVQTQQEALDNAARFVDAGLLTAEAVADLDLACCTATLQAALPQPVQSVAAQVEPAVHRRVRASAPRASLPALDGLRAALAASGWLPPQRRDVLLVALAAARHGRDDASEVPFTAEQVAQLRAQYGTDFDEGLAIWVGAFAETPEGVWTAVRDIATSTLPDAIANALRARSEGLSAGEKYALAQPALDSALTSPPDPSFLRAVRFSEADPGQAGAKMVELAQAADTNPERGIVLSLWHQLSPIGEANQRRLVDDIYLPLVGVGPEGVDLALEHFGLVASLRAGSRRAVQDALRDNAGDDDQKRRVDARLKEAGWLRKSMFGLGPLVDADE